MISLKINFFMVRKAPGSYFIHVNNQFTQTFGLPKKGLNYFWDISIYYPSTYLVMVSAEWFSEDSANDIGEPENNDGTYRKRDRKENI